MSPSDTQEGDITIDWLLAEKHILFDKAPDSRTMAVCQTS
jgi:hypothetical protein